MNKSIMQVYVKGSHRAVPFYQRAFDAEIIRSYQSDDGSFFHVEIDAFGQIFAISEANYSVEHRDCGNTMQFCFQFENEEQLRKVYNVLREGSSTIFPLGPVSYSEMMVDLIDIFGVRWSLFL